MQSTPDPAARHAWTACSGVVLLAMWGFLHQWWFPAGDDLLFTQVNQGPAVDFSLSQWFSLMIDDWTQRNGRLADSVLRLALRPGYRAFTLFGPVALTCLGLGSIWWLTAPRWTAARTLCAAGLFPAMLLLWPAMTGDTVLWAAGAVNYVWPTVGVLAVSGAYLRLLHGWRPSPQCWAGLAIAGVGAQLMHELASLSLTGMALLILVLQHRTRDVSPSRLPLVSLGGTALQMSAPGLWNRLGRSEPDGPVPTLVERVALSAEQMVGHTAPLWIALSALLAVSTSHRRGWGRSACGTAAAFTGLLVCSVLLMPTPTTGHSSGSGGLLTGLLVLALAAVSLALFGLIGVASPTPAVAWVACLACWGPPMLMGLQGARAFMLPALWLALAVSGLCLDLVDSRSPWSHLDGGLAVVVLLMAIAWLVPASLAARQNKMWINAWVEPQMRAAREGTVHRVLLPLAPPRPAYCYVYTYRLPRYDEALHRAHALPPEVELEQQSRSRIEQDPRIRALPR